MISELSELLSVLKKLFAESDADEQVCPMTIAPRQWCRQKIRRWCVFLSDSLRIPLIFTVLCH